MSGLESSSRIVYRDEFGIVGRKQGKCPSVITRAWNDAEYASRFDLDFSLDQMRAYRELRPINLNFTRLMKVVREIEQGQRNHMLLGQTSWNIVAELNNAELRVNDSEYLIPWVDHIHNDFRNGEQRRIRAAERLQDVYGALSSVAVEPFVELII